MEKVFEYSAPNGGKYKIVCVFRADNIVDCGTFTISCGTKVAAHKREEFTDRVFISADVEVKCDETVVVAAQKNYYADFITIKNISE